MAGSHNAQDGLMILEALARVIETEQGQMSASWSRMHAGYIRSAIDDAATRLGISKEQLAASFTYSGDEWVDALIAILRTGPEVGAHKERVLRFAVERSR